MASLFRIPESPRTTSGEFPIFCTEIIGQSFHPLVPYWSPRRALIEIFASFGQLFASQASEGLGQDGSLMRR